MVRESGIVAHRSPRILAVSWGHMTVAGLGDGKDFKLYPGGGRAWDWSETGTRHEPGIQPADVAELLERGARYNELAGHAPVGGLFHSTC
jgi:hypothetical protein